MPSNFIDLTRDDLNSVKLEGPEKVALLVVCYAFSALMWLVVRVAGRATSL